MFCEIHDFCMLSFCEISDSFKRSFHETYNFFYSCFMKFDYFFHDCLIKFTSPLPPTSLIRWIFFVLTDSWFIFCEKLMKFAIQYCDRLEKIRDILSQPISKISNVIAILMKFVILLMQSFDKIYFSSLWLMEWISFFLESIGEFYDILHQLTFGEFEVFLAIHCKISLGFHTTDWRFSWGFYHYRLKNFVIVFPWWIDINLG